MKVGKKGELDVILQIVACTRCSVDPSIYSDAYCCVFQFPFPAMHRHRVSCRIFDVDSVG